jgi:hypothetical protein
VPCRFCPLGRLPLARGKGNAQLIPGWPYSVVAALEAGRTNWTLPRMQSASARPMKRLR